MAVLEEDAHEIFHLDKNMKIEPSTIIDENTRMFRNCVTIKLVDNIDDILKYALVEHTMEFNDEL